MGSGSFLLAGASHQNSPPSFQIESQLPEIRAQCDSESECEVESKQKTMKAKHLFLAIAALLAAGGLWFARAAWRAHASHKSSMGVSAKMPRGGPKPG